MSLKTALQSPRFCKDGTIRWYEGDTGKINFNLTFKDKNKEIIPIQENDVLVMSFYNRNKCCVHEIKVVGTNLITLDVNREVTTKFTKGTYIYTLILNGTDITTLIKNNPVVVE